MIKFCFCSAYSRPQQDWHSLAAILAQSCPFTANPYLLYYVQLKLCKSAAPVGAADFYFNAKVVVLIHTFLQTARKTLKNQRGEANYFSTVVFIFIAVILLAFIIDLFGIISTKQELDHAADQMVKQIQLSGGSPIHLVGNPSSRVVYVIEGLLKADISHCLTGRTFAAIAGANNITPLEPLFAFLAQNGTEEIIEAHDMDKYNNQAVMNGASKIYLTARKYGMNCRRLTWNPNYKGFDDWQLALRRESQKRKEVEKLSFKEQYLWGLCELNHIEDCTEQWHHREENDIGLMEYLGLTPDEYAVFLRQGREGLVRILDSQRQRQHFVLYQLELDEGQAIPFAFKGIDALKKAGYCQGVPKGRYSGFRTRGPRYRYCAADRSSDH